MNASCVRLSIPTYIKKKFRFRYVETLNQNQIPPATPSQAALDQPSISIDTDRNLDLDLRQTGSRSIDQPKSDPESENRRSYRSPQRRPSFRSATPPQEADRPIWIRSTSPLKPPPYITPKHEGWERWAIPTVVITYRQ